MARSEFRLATLLRLAAAARDERRSQLAEAQTAEDALRGRREQLDDRRADLRARLDGAIGPGPVDVDRLTDVGRYEIVMKADEQSHAQQQTALAEEIERRRVSLVEADVQVQTLEKLRGRHDEREATAVRRAETKQMDEIAGRRARTE